MAVKKSQGDPFHPKSTFLEKNAAVARCLFRKPRHAWRLMQSILVFLIRAYRVVFAPLKVMTGLQGSCRFTPTCSRYAEEAIRSHGVCRGICLGAGRVLRCHPWGGMGPDPVPPAAVRTAL